MYGYEPPKQEPEGSWSEVWLIMRAAFSVLLPALALIALGGLLLVSTILLFLTRPMYALIPLAFIVLGFVWLIRRDKRVASEEEQRLLGPR